jgi:hypothetical protein
MNSRSRRHGKEPSRTEAREARLAARVRGLLPVFAGAIAIIGAGLWFGGRLATGGAGEHSNAVPQTVSSTTSPAQQTLPQFISTASPRVREAYEFAAGHGAELAYVPCYCGCGGHSGHRSARDCFVKQQTMSGITYDEHGSGCDICVSIVLDVKRMQGQGQSLAAARKYIDGKYAKIGPSTDTPLPPGMEE